MAVDKSIYQAPEGIPDTNTPEGDLTVEIAPDEDDEGTDVELDSVVDSEDEHYKNLAEDMDEGDLTALGDDVTEMFQDDLLSREDWEKTYKAGLELLGLKIEERTEPWAGACGVVHPLLTEAVVRFQSEAITELFTASGPTKTMIIGKTDKNKEDAARRVRDDMNYRLTVTMKEYRAEHERMLWNLGAAGSAFKKIYTDPSLGRPVSLFVSAEDFVVPYGTTDLNSAHRYTHRMKMVLNDIKKLQNSGFYRDIDLEGAKSNENSSDSPAKAKLTGQSDINDDRVELCEMNLDLDLEGYEDKDENGEETGIALPYIVSFERYSGEILSVYRNWKYEDKLKLRRTNFVHYPYVPGFGFYGYGLIHLIGGFAKSATSILRQLTDAGTLSNLSGGWKTKGVRFESNTDPIIPGEFRDVDVPSGTLKENIVPLPFKEPSATLYQLFNTIVDEGRRVGAVADVNVSDMGANAPVGTTLALLERQLKVMSAIQARMHAAMMQELIILKELIREELPDEYDYDVDDTPDNRKVKKADYDLVEIIPVTDPNASTMSQRVIQYQAVMQMAQASPQIYDQAELNKQMCEVMGVKNIDKLIPSSKERIPQDPVTENMAIITGKPVKAFLYQDQDAHIKTHMALLQDPMMSQMVGQSPNANLIYGSMAAHVAEHVAFKYRQDIEKQLGVALPNPEDAIPEEVERNLSVAMATASAQLTQQNAYQSQQQENEKTAQDPIIQQQQADLDLRKQELELRAKIHEDTIQLRAQELQGKFNIDDKKIASTEKIKGAELGVKISDSKAKMASNEKLTGAKLGVEIGKHSR